MGYSESTIAPRFPAIEFRDGTSGRRAGLRSGPDVWEIVMVARDYGENWEKLAVHFGTLPLSAIKQALEYARQFPEEVDRWISDNERVAHVLRQAVR